MKAQRQVAARRQVVNVTNYNTQNVYNVVNNIGNCNNVTQGTSDAYVRALELLTNKQHDTIIKLFEQLRTSEDNNKILLNKVERLTKQIKL